ncbi:hypothetical protein ACSBR2_012981 [Camellia fascicularis]
MVQQGNPYGHGNEGGGSQPVVRQHSGRGVWSRRADATIHSIFVDNIPESMRTSVLYTIFSNYADMAVQKAHGLWCDDRALKVKMAEFGKEEEIVRRGFGDIKVRMGGGRDMVLTFKSAEAMKDKFQKMQEWLNECIGKIWGALTDIDDDTLWLNSLYCGKIKIATTSMDSINHTINLECKGKIYPMRVCEEQIIVSKPLQDQCVYHFTEWKNGVKTFPEAIVEAQITDKSNKHEEEDDDVEVQLGKKSDLRGDMAGVGNIVSPAIADEQDGD